MAFAQPLEQHGPPKKLYHGGHLLKFQLDFQEKRVLEKKLEKKKSQISKNMDEELERYLRRPTVQDEIVNKPLTEREAAFEQCRLRTAKQISEGSIERLEEYSSARDSRSSGTILKSHFSL